MNFFAHAIRFLDRPWFICGVSVPDWLNAVDRRCRVRKRNILQALPQLDGPAREVAFGILQHLDDDHWFHGTAAFFEVNNRLALDFRAHLGADESWHCGFLGHIILELLIDAELITQDPSLLDRYYENFADVDPDLVEEVVSALATCPATNLGRLIPRYVEEQFLPDYLTNERLLFRLNQVMRRLGLPPLPVSICQVLDKARVLVAEKLPQLLPAEHFVQGPTGIWGEDSSLLTVGSAPKH